MPKYYNEVVIHRTKEEIFDYVTQPWRWCEWHPSSQSAHKPKDVLELNDEFDEVIRFQPFDILPLYIRKATHYRVTMTERAAVWEVQGEMNGGKLTIHYDFKEAPEGTLFCRTLNYEVSGLNTLLQPILNPKMERLSGVAVNNLKAKLESTE